MTESSPARPRAPRTPRVVSRSAEKRRVAAVATAFAELDEAHRVVLSLHYLEGLSLAQIAHVLDDSEARVTAVYREAVALLTIRVAERRRNAA